MAALTKNAISVTMRDRAKWTKIWDHKGYKSQITNIFINSKFKMAEKKSKMAALTKNAISVTVRDRAKRTKIWDHKGYSSQIINIFKNSKFYKKNSKWPP